MLFIPHLLVIVENLYYLSNMGKHFKLSLFEKKTYVGFWIIISTHYQEIS